MVADRIKSLRENMGLTQAGLAKILNLTRSSINAWEMGFSVPSTQYIIELAQFFGVSSDYLLGISGTPTISISGLTEDDVTIVHSIVTHLRNKNSANQQ